MKINMKLNENDRFDEFLLGSKDTHKLEFALTKILKKKYSWINSINLKVVVQDREFQNYYIYFGGMISVDENWAKQIWGKTKVTDFPGNEGYNYQNYEGLSLHEFLSKDMIEILSNDFTQIAKGVVLFKKDIVYSKVGNLLVYFEDNNKETNLKEHIRRVLKEETEVSTYLRRRIDMLDYEIEHRLSAIYRPNNICQYENEDELLDVIMEAAIDSTYWNYFGNIDDNSKEWVKLYNEMVQYVMDKYGDEIRNYYIDNCGSKKKEMGEEELTEKCWAGYTQKGMKTMFGKRYPNCVKKTKK
jgi:hypothetical protein